MSSTYAGNPANYPDNLTFLTDGDPARRASTYRPGLEGLADRTAYLKASLSDRRAVWGSLPTLNFHAGVTAALVDHVKYDPVNRRWFGSGVGGTDRLVSTPDPFVWPASSEITGLNVLTLTVWDHATNTAGDMVALAKSIDQGWKRTAAGVWSTVGGIFGNDPGYPSIVFESTSSLWCAAARRDASTALDVSTSTDGVTWVSRTAPTGMPTSGEVTLGAGNGVIVMRVDDGSGNLYLSRSTDGGITWSAATSLVLGFTPFVGAGGTREPAPFWNGEKWIVVASNVSSGRTRLYSSTDGATFTLLADIQAGISYLATMGGDASLPMKDLLVATWNNSGGQLLHSTDGGVNWWYGTRKLASSITSVAASKAQFALAAGGQVFPGVAWGPGLAVVTAT